MKQPNPSKVVGMASGAAKTVKRAGMQEALLKSEEWLRLAAEGSPMGLWYWNEETGRVFWDVKSCEIFGVNTEGEKTLDTFYGSLHPDDVERVRQVWRYQLEHGLPCDVEYRVIRPDGNMRWVHARGSGYYDETGKPLRMVGVHFDITERKKAERERMELSGRLINAQERERSRLARELHDDFSQRLAVLGRRLEKVAQSIEDSKPEVSKQLRELTDLSDNIGSDLHTLSHRLHSSGLEVLGLVQNVGPFCREFAKEHGIQVDFECTDVPESTAPEITLCLYRIVQEGLRNVRKHSQASGVEVRLKGDSQSISLTLSDNGVGFELSDRYTSNGIGLQSMKERARMLSGTFEVRSRPMQGTQIRVTVPLKRVPEVFNVFA